MPVERLGDLLPMQPSFHRSVLDESPSEATVSRRVLRYGAATATLREPQWRGRSERRGEVAGKPSGGWYPAPTGSNVVEVHWGDDWRGGLADTAAGTNPVSRRMSGLTSRSTNGSTEADPPNSADRDGRKS